MNGYIVGQLLETITLVLLCFCFLIIIISSFYDVWMTRQQEIIHLQTKRLRRYRPHVTILVYVQSSAQVISSCLESISKNRYRQYDITVITSTPTDDTKRQLLRFQQAHPTTRLRVYNQRKKTTVHTALQLGYKKSQRGEIILTLRPDTIISRTFLKESVTHFMATGAPSSNSALLFNEQFPQPQNIIGSLQQFLQVSRRLVRKVTSLLRLGRLPISEHATYTAMYESSAFMKKAVRRWRHIYDSTLQLQVLTLPSLFLSKKRVLNELVLFYLSGIIAATYVTYSLYMAATLQNTALLFVGWLIVVVWFFAAVWSDDATKVSDKLRLSFVLPSLYFFLYLMVVVEVIVRFIMQVYKSTRAIVQGTILFYSSPVLLLEE